MVEGGGGGGGGGGGVVVDDLRWGGGWATGVVYGRPRVGGHAETELNKKGF